MDQHRKPCQRRQCNHQAWWTRPDCDAFTVTLRKHIKSSWCMTFVIHSYVLSEHSTSSKKRAPHWNFWGRGSSSSCSVSFMTWKTEIRQQNHLSHLMFPPEIQWDLHPEIPSILSPPSLTAAHTLQRWVEGEGQTKRCTKSFLSYRFSGHVRSLQHKAITKSETVPFHLQDHQSTCASLLHAAAMRKYNLTNFEHPWAMLEYSE